MKTFADFSLVYPTIGEVKAYQQSVGLVDDGILGWDTLSRWCADSDPLLPWMLRRAFKQIGVIKKYSMDIAQQGRDCADCSEFICRVLGITKKPLDGDTLNWWLNTDGILTDALGKDVLFHDIPLAEAKPGDMVVYGHHDGHVGHIAMVVDPARRVIVDCSGSRDGVHCHLDDKANFWTRHDVTVYCLRYVGPQPAALV